MSKEAVFTMKLEAELRADFMAEVAVEDRPASQVMRELMRSYIEQRRQAREYDEYLRRKVEAGRASMRAGRGRSNDEVRGDCRFSRPARARRRLRYLHARIRQATPMISAFALVVAWFIDARYGMRTQ